MSKPRAGAADDAGLDGAGIAAAESAWPEAAYAFTAWPEAA